MDDPSSKKIFSSPFKRPSIMNSVKPGSEHLLSRAIFFCGIASCLEILLTYPTEYVKTQLQLDEKGDKKLYKGIIDCVRKTVQLHGAGGLYRGLSILIYGSILKTPIRFGSFEIYKEQLLKITESYSLNPSQSFICGFAAGITEALLIVTPIETIKVQFIDDQRSGKFIYKESLHGVGAMFKKQGITGMYKGVAATVARQGTSQATRFWVMDKCKSWYRSDDAHKPIPTYVIGAFGGLAGFASVVVNNPLDVVKTRMQAIDAVKYKSTLDCFIKTLVNEGPLSFYKGTVPRSCRAVLDVSISFMIYESFMQKINKLWPCRQPKKM